MSGTAKAETEWLRDTYPHVLVVAHQTATTSGLLEAVRKRAQQGEVTFHLLVPEQPHDAQKGASPGEPGADEAQRVLDAALAKLSQAAGDEVTGSVGESDPLTAIQDARHHGDYDETVISTLPLGASPGLKLDVVSKAPAGPASDPRSNNKPGAGWRGRDMMGAVRRARVRASAGRCPHPLAPVS